MGGDYREKRGARDPWARSFFTSGTGPEEESRGMADPRPLAKMGRCLLEREAMRRGARGNLCVAEETSRFKTVHAEGDGPRQKEFAIDLKPGNGALDGLKSGIEKQNGDVGSPGIPGFTQKPA